MHRPSCSSLFTIDGIYCGIKALKTGKALKNYIGDPDKGQIVDYYHARRIINGLDKAAVIEGYAKEFEQALDKASETA